MASPEGRPEAGDFRGVIGFPPDNVLIGYPRTRAVVVSQTTPTGSFTNSCICSYSSLTFFAFNVSQTLLQVPDPPAESTEIRDNPE
jgi:hypothetical protein